MYFYLNKYARFKVSLINAETKAIITNLVDYTDIKFQFKDSVGGTSIIAKTKANGITINTPATGDIQVELEEDDFITSVTTGHKYIGASGVRSDGEEEIFEITEDGRLINTIEFKASPVT